VQQSTPRAVVLGQKLQPGHVGYLDGGVVAVAVLKGCKVPTAVTAAVAIKANPACPGHQPQPLVLDSSHRRL
jgi:hypothetical protein